MADDAWRAAERRWRADPSDQAALSTAIDGMRRAGLRPPAALLDARLEPGATIDVPLPVEVWAVLPHSTTRTVGWGPGLVEVPACHMWGITSQRLDVEHLRALGASVRERRVPGLRIGDVRMSVDLDRAALDALGPQPHLRSLALPERGIHRFHVDDVLEAAGGAELRALAVDFLDGPERRSHERRGQVARLRHSPRLRDVRLDSCGVRPEHLAVLDELPDLDALSLRGNDQVAFTHVAALAGAARLRALELGSFGRSVMTDDDVASIAAFEGLERLTVWWWYDLSEAGAAHLARAPSLKELRLWGAYHVGDAAVEAWVDGLPALEALALAGPRRITDHGLSVLARVPNLRHLELEGYDLTGGPEEVTDAGVERLVACEHLSSLLLRDAPAVTGRGLASLGRLERLTVSGCTDAGLQAIARLPRLRELAVDGTFSGQGVRALAALRGLERLELRCARASSLRAGDLAFVGDLADLTSLMLASPLDDELFARIGALPRLEHFGCFGGGVTDAGLTDLAGLPLRTLFLSTDVSADGVVRAFAGHPTLRRLTVSGPARRELSRIAAALPLVAVR